MPTAGWSPQDITDLFTKIDNLQTTLTTVHNDITSSNTKLDSIITAIGTVNTNIGTTNTSLSSIKTDFEGVVGATTDVTSIHAHSVPAQSGDDPNTGKLVNLIRHINNYHDDAFLKDVIKGSRFKTPSFSQPILEAPGREDTDGNNMIYAKDFIFKNDDELLPSEVAANAGFKPPMFVNAERLVDRTDTSVQKIAYSDYKAWVADDSLAPDPTITYALTVSGGSYMNGTTPMTSGNFASKSKLTVVAGTPPPGTTFNHWVCSNPAAYLADIHATTTTFGTPASISTLTAVFV